ncbi:unnamed protein product [Hyaloperonospora brassicae]|uniref:Aminopeptidase n=1 Tax=Hyaloperonospora brassicae TaxID=162125 RepID=A0AAV0T824_HYABA|nr:unnamed protein product [Hyaloperonospora brassicae]
MSTSELTFQRLPSCAVPHKYYIDYERIDLLNYRFEGSERVTLDVREATSVLTCHAVELHVFNVYVDDEGDAAPVRTQQATAIHYNRLDDSVAFHFATPLRAPARVTLRLQFRGALNDQLRGFYRTHYTAAASNEQRALAVTQFQACDARRAFVCWDEPALKATFTISMVTDIDVVALSNTHVLETFTRPRANAQLRHTTRAALDGPYGTFETVWRFAETPVMSTYLVAMVVGEFDQLSRTTSDGVTVSVYTAPGQRARGAFALDVAVRALAFFTQRFQVPYPLAKLDMVAVPDFLGAMENWGLVTYTEAYLLVDPQLSSHAIKADATRAICHELSHQWFGNLVTMTWWTGLWLNEGFAQYMEFAAADSLFPRWRLWETFVQDITLRSALVKDAMVSSHPIEVVVNHPDEADEIFDAISYHKGSSVVRMLAEYLGRDVFYDGVRDYLVQNSYKNAVTEDLWEALETASGQKLKAMADTWTKQVGFPLLTLTQDDDGKCTIAQERFFADSSSRSTDNTLWDIPLTLCTSENRDTVQRLGIWNAKTASSQSAKAVTTPLVAGEDINSQIEVPAGPEGWIMLNPNQTGFYLVNYAPALWKRLELPVTNQLLGVPDRVSLLNSAFALARAGVLRLPVALDFTGAYVNEPASLCWKEISRNMGYYSNLFSEEAFFPQFQQYVRTLFAQVMKELRWDADPAKEADADEGEFRQTVIRRLGLAGDKDVIAEANKRFHAYIGGNSAILSGDLRRAVFDIEVAFGDASSAKLLQELHNKSDFAEERDDCLAAMGSVSDPSAKLEVLEWAVENVRSQGIHHPFISVASDKAGANVAWQYVKEKWDVLAKKYSATTLGMIVCGTVSCFQTMDMATEVEAFMADKDTSGYRRRLNVALEAVRLKSATFGRDRDPLAKWLETREAK